MGGGASNSKQWTIFVNSELVDGSRYLAGDAQFRYIFVNYVKSEQWTDRLLTMILEERRKDSANSLVIPDPDKLWLQYDLAADAVCDLGEKGPKGKLARSPKISKTSRNILSDSSLNAICAGFSSRQLESIIFSVLYPLFASTPDEECTPRSSCATRTNDACSEYDLSKSHRVQEIITSCADNSSEEEMHEFLQNPEWVFETSDTFDNFPLSISVCDTDKPGCPIVYANKAFETMSGYTLSELVGHSLDLMHGGATEISQVLQLKEAVATGRATKVGITHYNKKAKAFLDLVAVRASAHYSVAVHFPASPQSYPEDLKMVDDLLLLLCCVLQAPLQKSTVPSSPTLHSRSLEQARANAAASNSVNSLTRLLARSSSAGSVHVNAGVGVGLGVGLGADQQWHNFSAGGGGLSVSGKSMPSMCDNNSIHPLVF